LTVVQAVRPTVSFYRYLYNTVGRQWQWVDRHKLSDGQLATIIRDPAVEIYVLYVNGVPAGYAELDRRQFPHIELAYFGIMPEFIGQKLGPYLLRWSIDKAFSYSPRRLWLHTCTLDHPKALATYRRAGFQIYSTEAKVVDDP
jgi:GNAT superfamily N-acetyltransferase